MIRHFILFNNELVTKCFLIMVLPCHIQYTTYAHAEEAELTDAEIEEYKIALSRGWVPAGGEMSSMRAAKQLLKRETIPDILIQCAIKNIVSKDSHKRVPARVLFKDIKLKVEHVGYLMATLESSDSLWSEYSYEKISRSIPTRDYLIIIASAGEPVIPLLKFIQDDQSNPIGIRNLAQAGIERINIEKENN